MNEILLNSKDFQKAMSNLDQISEKFQKISQFANLKFNFDFSSIDGIQNTVKDLDGMLTGVVKGFSSLGSFNANINELAKNGSVLAQAYNLVNGALLGNVANLNLHTIATNIANAASTAFKATLEFLSANPLIAVAGAIGLVVGACMLFGEKESEAEKQTRLFTEAQEQKREELVKTAQAINESTAAAVDKAKDAEVQSDVLRGYVEALKELEKSGINESNMEQAKYYIDQINSAMPGTVEMTKKGTLSWGENEEAIEKNIQALERKAKVEAYYDGYVESLKNETRLRGELTLAQNNYNSEMEKLQANQAKYNELMAEYKEKGRLDPEKLELLEGYKKNIDESNKNLEQYSETLDKARGAYEANAKGAELYQSAVNSLDGDMSASAKLQLEEYTVLEEDGTSTWASLAAAKEDCSQRMQTASEEELAVLEQTSELAQTEMIHKAKVQGLTYDEMIKQLEDAGMKMSDDEKRMLQESYDAWNLNGEDIRALQSKDFDTLKAMRVASLSDMNDAQKEKLTKSIEAFAKAGDSSGLELCEKLAESIEKNGGVIDEDMEKQLAEIEKRAEKACPEIFIKARIHVAADAISGATQKVVASLSSIKIPKFASGGFPSVGEMFIAREAGPELVGRINSKTAVANNDQIITGISAGVYNALRHAMAEKTGGSINLNATLLLDGEAVGKQVIKYHNGVVRRTGTSPLFI